MREGDDYRWLASHIGGVLAERRRKAGRTQEELAEACDISPSYLARIERGERLPSTMAIVRIARALDMDAAALFVDPRDEPAVPEDDPAREEALARLRHVVTDLDTGDIKTLTRAVAALVRAGEQ